MSERTDLELLQAWSRDRCEESFRCLVERYGGLVFGTAMRRMDRREQAQEVAQNVFVTLAGKAGQVHGEGGIGGWLFKATVLEARARQRSETRRERRMRDLRDIEEARRGSGGEALPGEALAVVDEGLAGLRSRDRELLLARFFRGLSFPEIAERTGRSEAACRKQASRALDKLARVLARRGILVSGTVLSAGLAAMMSAKVPAGVAGAWAATATAGSKAVVSGGFLTAMMTAMSVSKTTGILVIGGIMVLASSGAGYLAGREGEQARGGGKSSREGAWSAGAGGARGAGVIDGATASRERGDAESRVEAIMKALRREVRGLDLTAARLAGQAVVAELRRDEMAEAVAMAEGAPSPSGSIMLDILYAHWGGLDGRVAAERALEHADRDLAWTAVNAAMRAWAAVDPTGAWQWQEGLRKRAGLPIAEADVRRLAGAVLQEWAGRDMGAAWDAFEELGHDLQGATLHQLAELILRPEHTRAMAERMAAIGDERLKSQVAEGVGEEWARHDPQAATRWFDTLEFDDPLLRLRAAMEIGEGWFDSDPAAAGDWLWPMVPEEMHREIARSLARSPWARNDPEGLSQWLATRGFTLEQLSSEER